LSFRVNSTLTRHVLTSRAQHFNLPTSTIAEPSVKFRGRP
jgi:hypothetical protein